MRSSVLLIVLIVISGLVTTTAVAEFLDPGDPDVDVVLNTEDARMAFYNGPSGQIEWLYSYGKSSIIRIKGYDDPSVFRWNLSAYQGQTILEAELHLCLYSSSIVNALVASTVNVDWHEGNKAGGTAGVGDPCWRWREYPDVEWSFVGSDFSTASFGNFGTLVCYGYKHNDTFKQYTSGPNNWIAMKLDPDVVHAMILDNYGITVTDPRWGGSSGNPSVYSKDQNSTVQPRLYIKAVVDDVTGTGDVANLTAEAGEWNGEVVLSFEAPVDPLDGKAFGYDVRYSTGGSFATATKVDRWRIPRPGEPGTTDRLLIEDLTPGDTYNFWVQAYDKVGNTGNAVMTSLALPGAIATPQLADGGFPTPDPSGKSILGAEGKLNYWACSELAKVNPATGNRMADGYTSSGADDYKKANVVWDSETNTITLRPGRNEVIGFQMIVQRLIGSLTGVAVGVGDLTGPGVISAADNSELYKLHYSGSTTKYPDPAIPLFSPLATTFDIPDANTNPGGTYQSVWCDLYVPRDAAVGTYNGTVTIDCDQIGSPVAVNLQVIVHEAVIPDFPTFFLDLNGYGNDKWSSTASRYQVFQLCQKHRMVPNTLPYGWSGNWTADRAPTLTGSGPTRAVSSWTTFDNNYGPFFDGSGFSPTHPTYPYHGPGENTPIANFYTTGFEGWPNSLTHATWGYDAAGMGWSYWNNLVDNGGTAGDQEFWLEAPDVMEAFPAGYGTGYRNVFQQFAAHAQANGWGTAFQMYLNNKRGNSNTIALWTLEEQVVADDFRADRWFMGLCKDGWEAAGAPDVKFQWRIDTSTRWSQNWGQLKDICNLRCQGDGKDWNYRHDRYRKYTEQMDEMRWWYGTGPGRTSSLTDHGAEILEHWSHGLDGGLPYWDSYHTDWTGTDILAVLMSGDSVPGHGYFDGRIGTIRMKGMRHAQQLCEYLNMLADQPDWNRNLAARALSVRYGDNSGRGYDAYGGDEYGGVSILEYYQLHADLLASIAPLVLIGDFDDDGDVDLDDYMLFEFAMNGPGQAPGYGDPDLDGDGDCDLADFAIFAANFTG